MIFLKELEMIEGDVFVFCLFWDMIDILFFKILIYKRLVDWFLVGEDIDYCFGV